MNGSEDSVCFYITYKHIRLFQGKLPVLASEWTVQQRKLRISGLSSTLSLFPLPQPLITKNKHSNWQYRTHQSQALVNLRQSGKTKKGEKNPCFANNALIRCVNKNPLAAMALGPEKQIVKISHTRSSTQGFPSTSLSTHHTHTHTRKPPFLSHWTL